MSLADNMAKTALNLIKKYGSTIVVTRVTVKGTYNSATGVVSNPTTAQQTVKGVIKDFDSRAYSAPNILIQTDDKEILIAASGFSKPGLADTFTADGITYTIVPLRDNGLEVQSVMLQDKNVLFKIHGRKT